MGHCICNSLKTERKNAVGLVIEYVPSIVVLQIGHLGSFSE